MTTETATAITSAQYVQHHLEHLTLGLHNFKLGGDSGFWTLNLDTVLVSLVLGLIIASLLRLVAVRMTAGVPGKLQNFV